MRRTGWPVAETAARLLGPLEREAVLGDLAEAGEGGWEAALGVLGLVARREAALWVSWRPWLAAFGVALPESLLLMGVSIAVSGQFRDLMARGATAHEGLARLTGLAVLLAGWSWTGGFVVGAVSRRTLWASAAAVCAPCLFCLSRFRMESLPSLCLFLFLAPALWGVREGLRGARMRGSAAMGLAAAMTALMVPMWGGGSWLFHLTLIWPAWYMAAATGRAGYEERRTAR